MCEHECIYVYEYGQEHKGGDIDSKSTFGAFPEFESRIESWISDVDPLTEDFTTYSRNANCCMGWAPWDFGTA